MKQLLFFTVFFTLWTKYHRVADTNALKEEAAYYYESKNYKKCVLAYEKLIQSYNEVDENLKLNLANCYFHLGKDKQALENYKQLSSSKTSSIKSNAYLQMGVLYYRIDKKEVSLSHFKDALKANPDNEYARYNYELVKKIVDQQEIPPTTEKKNETSDGKYKINASTTEELKNTNTTTGGGKHKGNKNNEDEREDEESSGDVEEDEMHYDVSGEKETDALTSKRLAEVKMSEQQARVILKAMRNAEIQYIQQRKKMITSKPVPGKPNW